MYEKKVDQPAREHLVGKFRVRDGQSPGTMDRLLYLYSSSLLHLDRPIQTTYNE